MEYYRSLQEADVNARVPAGMRPGNLRDVEKFRVNVSTGVGKQRLGDDFALALCEWDQDTGRRAGVQLQDGTSPSHALLEHARCRPSP